MDEIALPEGSPEWLTYVIGALVALIPALTSTLVKSDRAWMKIIDVLAFNWGKARNDPEAQ